MLGALTISLLASTALAIIAPTEPVVSSEYRGGQNVRIAWIDDDSSPSSSSFGPTSVGLFVGSINTQFELQDCGNVADPAKTQSLRCKIDPSAGPNGDYYFFRFESLGNTTDAGVPLQAFSARFSLTRMTGELSAEAQAAVDGATASTPASRALAASNIVTNNIKLATSSTAAAPSSKPFGSSGSNESSAASSVSAGKTLMVALVSSFIGALI